MDNRHSTQTSTAHAHERTCTAPPRCKALHSAERSRVYAASPYTYARQHTCNQTCATQHTADESTCSDAVAQAYGSLGGDDKALEEVKKLFNDEIDKLVQVCRASCDDLKPELGC